jgi:hypothetical protein
VDPRAIVRLEGLSELKIPVTLSGIKSATFRLVAQWLNQRHKKGYIKNSSPMEFLKISQFWGGERQYGTMVEWRSATEREREREREREKEYATASICSPRIKY